VNISLGTPPQHFLVALQTMGTIPLVIPSTNCTISNCDGNPSNRYNSSLSSTYRSIGDESTEPYKRITYHGYRSIDALSIGHTTIPKIQFLEWNKLQNTSIQIADFLYDGILNLSPPWRGESSLLKSLIGAGNLDANMFSLELSKLNTSPGKLTIGAKDALLDHPNTIKLPMINHTNDFFANLWTTPIKSYSTPYREIQFPEQSLAVLDPGTFQTILPRRYGRPLLAQLGSIRYEWMNYIDCARVPDMPELVFTFGQGQTVKLTGADYVVKMGFDEYDLSVCTIAFDDAYYFPEIPDDTMILGSSFLRGFHSTWDWENRIVGCKYPLL